MFEDEIKTVLKADCLLIALSSLTLLFDRSRRGFLIFYVESVSNVTMPVERWVEPPGHDVWSS